MRLVRLLVLVLVVAVLPMGCDDNDRIEVYPITGKVTINGQPAEGMAIRFVPTSDDPMALKPTATTDAQGNLVVTSYVTGDGAPAGEYRLALEWPKKVIAFGRNQNGPDQLGGKFAEAGSSGITVTIQEGPTTLELIDLKAKIKDVKATGVRPMR